MKKSSKGKDIVLRQIIDHIPYFVFWKDRESRYLGVNKLFAASAGYQNSEDLVGKTDYDCCWTKEESDFFRMVDREVMDKDEPILNFEEPQKQLDGSTKTVLTSKVPLHDEDNNVVGILGIYSDITARKKLEQDKDQAIADLKALQQQLIHTEKMRSLGEMAGGIAHEINTPLAIISGNISFLKRLLLDGKDSREKILEILNDVDQTVVRISEIVKSLRSLSRDDSQGPLVLKPEKISDIVSECVSLCEQKFRDLAIDLRVTIQKDEPSLICNRTSLGQSVLNLLNNARDAAESAGGKKFVSLSVTFDDGCDLRVRDSGNGVAAENREKIFQPFFTTKEVGKGTGIGLSLSRSLIEKQGGSLTLCNSTKETTFCIHFPEQSLVKT